MSTLDFVPRTLKRRKVELSSTLEVQTSNCTPKIQRTEETTTQTKSKNHVPKLRKRQIVEPSWDFAFLVWLALSDYSLWADGDLRRRMETNAAGRAGLLGENQIVSGDNMTIDEKESQNASDDQGCTCLCIVVSSQMIIYPIDLPLDQLFKQSQVFYSVSEIQPYCDAKEIIYVNSLRQFAKDVIDVRFIVDPESSSTRTAVGSRRQRKPQSGYEVRRTDFASLKDSEFSRYSKSHWSALTVYMVTSQFLWSVEIKGLTGKHTHTVRQSTWHRQTNSRAFTCICRFSINKTSAEYCFPSSSSRFTRFYPYL